VVLTLKPDVYEIATLRAMEAFVEEAGQLFVEIQHQIEADERKARELRNSPTMTPEELAAIRSRWDELPPATPQIENGYALAHAPEDIRRLLAEIERLHSLVDES
jgi:hypothetical protein